MNVFMNGKFDANGNPVLRFPEPHSDSVETSGSFQKYALPDGCGLTCVRERWHRLWKWTQGFSYSYIIKMHNALSKDWNLWVSIKTWHDFAYIKVFFATVHLLCVFIKKIIIKTIKVPSSLSVAKEDFWERQKSHLIALFFFFFFFWKRLFFIFYF